MSTYKSIHSILYLLFICRYEHLKSGLLKNDQLKNPVYSDLPMTTEVRYATLIAQIRNMTRNINTTIAFNRLCTQSDDEDCYRNSFQHCDSRNLIFVNGGVSGSGSGSGDESGSGKDSGVTETATESADHIGNIFTTATTEKVITTPRRKIFNNSLNDEMGPSHKPPSTANPFTPGTAATDGHKEIQDNNIPMDDKTPKPPLHLETDKLPEVVSPEEKTTAVSGGVETTPQSLPPDSPETNLYDTKGTTTTNGGGSDIISMEEMTTLSEYVETAHTSMQPLTEDITTDMDRNPPQIRKPIISRAASFYTAEISTTCTLIACLAALVSL